MNSLRAVILMTLFLAVSANVFARDTIHDFPIEKAMSTEQARQKLAGMKFYFGDQKHGKVIKRYSTFGTSRKTNAFGKSDQAACEWVFLTTLIQLKERAIQLGANAVINIKSNYRNNLTSSQTTFQCGAGAVIAGVALQGEIVTLE